MATVTASRVADKVASQQNEHLGVQSLLAQPSKKPQNHNTFDNGETWKSNIRDDDDEFVTLEDGSRPGWFWTGVAPRESAPGMQADGTITSLPQPNLTTCTREQALDYFDNTWLLTEVVFSGLQGREAYYRPPYHNLRHPMIFYYAHPAALYVNKLRVAGLLDEPVDEYFEHIFETGVDEMAWDDLSKNDMQWPKIREVTEYRRQVYRIVRGVLESSAAFDLLPITWDSPEWALFMGFEHERIHLETSTVLIRELPLRLVKAPVWWPKLHPELSTRAAPANDLVSVPEGSAVVGKPKDWPTFGWDNEYGRRELRVPAFVATNFQVTNAEFLEFVRAGGYRDESLWSSDGWRWRTFRNAKWPVFWTLDGPAGLHQYSLRLIWTCLPLPLAAPAVVNAHEARAYAAWRSRTNPHPSGAPFRINTEAEHHRMRALSGTVDASTSTGTELRAAEGAALQLSYGSEVPVDAVAVNTDAPFPGACGNVWHWCEDFFAALPGGHGVHPLYDDFSSPCYDGQHNIIMGGSFMSTGDEASQFSRFHFRPHFHQHAGFRLVASAAPMVLTHVDSPPPHVGSWNPSSSSLTADVSVSAEEAVASAMLTQHVAAALTSPLAAILESSQLDFPSQVFELLRNCMQASRVPCGAALEVGCGVGGLSFKLAEAFESVMALDLQSEMITAACNMQTHGSTTVSIKQEGRVYESAIVSRRVGDEASSRVTFRQMDPCCLAPDIGRFDAVVLNDVLDKCVSPKGPLARMGGISPIVKPGGIVVTVSGYDWDARKSDPKMWLGGQPGDQGAQHGIASAMGSHFKAVTARDIPMVTREHGRKFSLQIMQVAVWRFTPPSM